MKLKPYFLVGMGKKKNLDLSEEVEEEIELEKDGDEEVPVEKPKRKKITIVDHLARYDKFHEMLEAEIDKRGREDKGKGARFLKASMKLLKEMRKDLPKIMGRKKMPEGEVPKRKGGLSTRYKISPELAKFLKVSKDSILSRQDVMRAIYTYIKFDENDEREDVQKWSKLNPGGERNLNDAENRLTVLPDKALSDLLRYEDYKKKVHKGEITRKDKNGEEVTVEDDSLKYWIIQKLLQRHFVEKVE
jgi:chromatin remodeling complex protein RSC6